MMSIAECFLKKL